MSFFERWKLNFFNHNLFKVNVIIKICILIGDLISGVAMPSHSIAINIITITIALILNIISVQALLASVYALFGYEYKVFEGLFGYDEEEEKT